MNHTKENGICSTSEYYTWKSMIDRCTKKNHLRYKYYGGRGIKVCDRWLHSPKNFIADMGKRPTGYWLERKDNNGNYCPENCIWASIEHQARNKRCNVNLTLNGQTMCLADWAKKLGLKNMTLYNRIKRGWSIEKALTKSCLGRQLNV